VELAELRRLRTLHEVDLHVLVGHAQLLQHPERAHGTRAGYTVELDHWRVLLLGRAATRRPPGQGTTLTPPGARRLPASPSPARPRRRGARPAAGSLPAAFRARGRS